MEDPETISPEEWKRRADARVAAQSARVEAEMAEMGMEFIPRGRARPVVREDGLHYPSVSDAARQNQVRKVDNICQAIRRGGKCSGFRWAYVGEEPKHFRKTAGMMVARDLTSSPSSPPSIPFTVCWPRYKPYTPRRQSAA